MSKRPVHRFLAKKHLETGGSDNRREESETRGSDLGSDNVMFALFFNFLAEVWPKC